MISKNKFLKNAQKVEVKQQMETGGILNKVDFIRQAQQAQRRQQDAFETYRAAVEEAKKTRANMGYPDVLSEQEFNRSGAMVQQHGTYDNYLQKAAGQYQAAKQEDISRQLTTQGLRREQTAQKTAAAQMRAQGNIGTQALRQQSHAAGAGGCGCVPRGKPAKGKIRIRDRKRTGRGAARAREDI